MYIIVSIHKVLEISCNPNLKYWFLSFCTLSCVVFKLGVRCAGTFITKITQLIAQSNHKKIHVIYCDVVQENLSAATRLSCLS